MGGGIPNTTTNLGQITNINKTPKGMLTNKPE